MTREFLEVLEDNQKETALCIEIAPRTDMEWIHPYNFVVKIVTHTAEVAAAYFIHPGAFMLSSPGYLAAACRYISENAPKALLILDMRGSEPAYISTHANLAYDDCKADAVVVSPYLGKDLLLPFLEREEKGVFVQCLSANDGVSTLEHLHLKSGRPLFEHVAYQIMDYWNKHGNCAIVGSAAYPDDLALIRKLCPPLPILVSDVTEETDLRSVVQATQDEYGNGLLISVSRDITARCTTPDFAIKAGKRAVYYRDEIEKFRTQKEQELLLLKDDDSTTS